ncbi:helix-turn-helix transcriptional regulator [Paenibacillus jilunlii]|uniref:Two-component system, response regulator YesN n=1 Tax=Paenibacillus jilunlii TaxID=682956 RepID=A0A1G9G399_9BACL|nr:helix-turn-helix transcriptional regulator [Paenibacillus jilunlii]SDK95139.1 two-component system, response regulator YesN [Paenibacillus jilunlii]
MRDYLLRPAAYEELHELLGNPGQEFGQKVPNQRAPDHEFLSKNDQIQLLRESFLLQMVRDEWPNLPVVRERLQQLGLAPLAADDLRLQCAAVEVRMPAEIMSDRQERRNLLNLAFHKLCRETSSDWKGIYPFADAADSAMMYFLVILKPGAEHARKTRRFIEQLNRSIASELKLECVSGIGGEVKGLKRLKNGYTSCMLSWSLSSSGKKADECCSDLELSQAFTPEIERKLKRAVENPDMHGLRQQLDIMLNNGRDTTVFTFLALRLVLLLASIAKKFELGSSSLQRYVWNSRMSIVHAGSPEGVRSLLDELAQLVMEEVKKVRFSDGWHLIEAVRKYAGENFCCRLELSSLAELFYLNEADLPRQFKQHVGITFSDYITKLRITKAEQLLQQNELKAGDIPRLAGYSGFGSFSTAFKKYSGISPKEYRERFVQGRAARGC